MPAKQLIIQAVPIREQVANIIRKQIITGELKTNQQLIERELSKELDISTTPIKEAFRILESEGLLYTVSRKGSYVANIDKNNLAEIVHVRSAFEGMIAFFAVPKLTEEEIATMGRLIAEIEPFVQSEQPEKIQPLANEFHDIIRCACKNAYLLKTLYNMEAVDAALMELHVMSSNRKKLLRKNHEEHVAIFEAVRSRDAALAEKLMREHKRRVAENALNLTL